MRFAAASSVPFGAWNFGMVLTAFRRFASIFSDILRCRSASASRARSTFASSSARSRASASCLALIASISFCSSAAISASTPFQKSSSSFAFCSALSHCSRAAPCRSALRSSIFLWRFSSRSALCRARASATSFFRAASFASRCASAARDSATRS